MSINARDSGKIINTHLDTFGDRQRTREPAETAFTDDESFLFTIGLELCLSGDSDVVVVDVDAYVLLVDTGELERRSDQVLVLVLMDINPITRVTHLLFPQQAWHGTYLGRKTRGAELLCPGV